MSDESNASQTVVAIRLALEGAADNDTALLLTRQLVEQAPDTIAADLAAPRLLLAAMRALGLSVSTKSPSGAYAPRTSSDG